MGQTSSHACTAPTWTPVHWAGKTMLDPKRPQSMRRKEPDPSWGLAYPELPQPRSPLGEVPLAEDPHSIPHITAMILLVQSSKFMHHWFAPHQCQHCMRMGEMNRHHVWLPKSSLMWESPCNELRWSPDWHQSILMHDTGFLVGAYYGRSLPMVPYMCWHTLMEGKPVCHECSLIEPAGIMAVMWYIEWVLRQGTPKEEFLLCSSGSC